MRSTALAAIAIASLYAIATFHVATVGAQTVTDASIIPIASKRGGGGKGNEENARSPCGEYKYYDAKQKQCADARDKKSEKGEKSS